MLIRIILKNNAIKGKIMNKTLLRLLICFAFLISVFIIPLTLRAEEAVYIKTKSGKEAVVYIVKETKHQVFFAELDWYWRGFNATC
jgi:hypothetical protein